MNINFTRTILGALAGLALMLPVIAKLFGCEIDNPATLVVETTTCALSWLPAQWTPILAFAFIAAGGLLKLFKSGTPTENLFAPSVPVVTAAEARPGVVTMAQVKTSNK